MTLDLIIKKLWIRATPKFVKDYWENHIKNRTKNAVISELTMEYDSESLPYSKFARVFFSQFGEDAVLLSLFSKCEFKQSGFYVDIGAHHPVHLSNTYIFYLNGWSGINVDAMPGTMKLFDEIRSRDINLEMGVVSKESAGKEMNFYVYKNGAHNTFSEDLVNKRDFKPDKKIQIKTDTLSSILDKYLPKDKNIDFLSIDAEGFDLEILESNDWSKYKPTYILVEDHSITNIDEITNSKIYQFLLKQGYKLISKTILTLIFGLEPIKEEQ